MLLCCSALMGWSQRGDVEQVDAWADGPAKQKLALIEEYRPAVRRSRTIAIGELEVQLKTAKEVIRKAERRLAYQKRIRNKNTEEVWDPERLVKAEEDLTALKTSVKESAKLLAYAKAENEKVMKFLVREQMDDSEGEGSDDEEDEQEDDEDEGVESEPQLRIKTRVTPDASEEEDLDED